VGEGHDNIPFDFTLFGRYDQGEIAEIDLQHLMPDFLKSIKPYRKIEQDTYKLGERISNGDNIIAWNNEPVYRVNIVDNNQEFVCSLRFNLTKEANFLIII
ncbi:MAG: hypothetical protein OQK82_07390, partial [Candidatus Pacearchaeota archaeon]|nr:hypothetical protein [Candidatus Pacearchaeota archaeon]